MSPSYYAVDALGSVTGSNSEYFNIGVTAGQNIAFGVNSTSPANPGTELLLYDANGNLVAIASGNASNGVSSLLGFTVPVGDAGNWTIAVTSPTCRWE